jgi:hypothetical protein
MSRSKNAGPFWSRTVVGASVGAIAVNDLFLLDSSLKEISSTVNSASVEVLPAGASVPEPVTYVLLLSALAIMAMARRRESLRPAAFGRT